MKAEAKTKTLALDVDLHRSIIQSMKESLVVLDEPLRVRMANRAFYETFKTSESATLGVRLYELGSGQWDIPRLRLLLEKIIPEKSAFDGFEVDHVFPSIGRKIMLLNARKLRGTAPDNSRILLVIEDITERKQLEFERDEALRLRAEMVGIVSHEIKNPLMAIVGSLDLLDRILPSFEGRENVDRLLQQISSASQRMTRITADLLEVTRIEAGKLSVERVDVDARSLIEDSVASNLPSANQKSVRFEFGFPEDGLRVNCDRDRMLQVLDNLLNNAIKFTATGGTVRIEASRLDDGRVRFSVSDTGCGIPAEELPHVFERFWQAKHRQYLGTGLGLYISRGIVEAHGGTIQVESIPGRGSVFSVLLPAAASVQGKAA